jgi:lipoprotein-releasing system permease protein
MLGLKDDEATHIKVQIDDPRYYSQVTLEIAEAVTGSRWHNADGDEAQFDANTAIDFAPYRITPWRAAKQNELSAAENDLRILSFIVVFIMLGAGFVLLAILVMMVFEKRKDIGIMKSVGSTWLGTVSIFLMMGLIIGMAGTGVGLLLGKLASDNINGIASTVEKVSGVKVFSAEIYKLDKIPAEFNWRSAAWISAMALGVSLLSSCFAAVRAAVIDPVKALRYE